MAHADYNCCAICDCKMTYNEFDSETKESICPDCIERTIATGHPCARPETFLELLKSLDDAAALTWLHAIGFEPCYYDNPVDDYLIERGLITKGDMKSGKWGKSLRPASLESNKEGGKS